VGEDPVGRVRNRFFPSGWDVQKGQYEIGHPIKFCSVAAQCVPEEQRFSHFIVGRPCIIHPQRYMVEVTGMNWGAGEVYTDALELGFNPLKSDVMAVFSLGKQREGQEQNDKKFGSHSQCAFHVFCRPESYSDRAIFNNKGRKFS